MLETQQMIWDHLAHHVNVGIYHRVQLKYSIYMHSSGVMCVTSS